METLLNDTKNLGIEENQLKSLTNTSLVNNYNERIRPMLDAVDKLRHLQVMKEGIHLPTIVVVGDQSSGKSSVIESLAGISLPRGQGICTRVPLIMRLQSHSTPEPEIYLEFHNKTLHTDESHISEDISSATDEIAGFGKGISNTPLTLFIKKQGVPDLTMVDLPGITRVPVNGQPEDIYEQISNIIMEYVSPRESIILNVLSATVDFPTCESIRMSQTVDKNGDRTLAAVTKIDKSPEGLLGKVTADDVNIGLGYVCVRNRIGQESYEEARAVEARLFESHPLLSKIDKSIVGIPVLAQKLVKIQANSLAKCLPDIVNKISDKLNQNVAELKKLPQKLSTVPQALMALMQILASAKESLKKILQRAEFDEYPDEVHMHCTARLVEMLDEYSNELQSMSKPQFDSGEKFLVEEIKILDESRGIALPNFLPRSAFITILKKKLNEISVFPIEFIQKVWNYIEDVVTRIVVVHSESYPQLQSSLRRAVGNLVLKMKQESVKYVTQIVEMEKLADYTCNPEYMNTFNNLMGQEVSFKTAINLYVKFEFGGNDKIEVTHLREYNETLVQQAFDMKMRMTSYWKIVLRRLVDSMGLYLLFCVNNFVDKEMEKEILNEVMGPTAGGIERMLEEAPLVASKRDKLNTSIKLLKESKEVVSKIMDGITSFSD